MALLELRGVTKAYIAGRERVPVWSGLELSIDEGELVAVVGRSGVGKTTLISLIAGLIAPDSGSLWMRGAEIRGPGPDRGVVFQSYSLLPWLTVHENVLLAVEQVLPRSTKEQQRAHADRYVAMVGLAAARDKRPSQLSGGMRQRVAVARALAMEPELLLLDEPLSALDALTRGNLQSELDRICRTSGKTILLITNDVDEALLLADRIVPIVGGRPAALGRSFVVDLPRPRDRRALNHDARFKALRAEIIDHLTSASARGSSSSSPRAEARTGAGT